MDRGPGRGASGGDAGKRAQWPETLAFLAVLVVAAGLRAHGVEWGLPGHFVPDEATFAPDWLWRAWAEPDPDATHFFYPNAQRWLVVGADALARLLADGEGWTVADSVRVGRWGNVVLSVATVAVTMQAARLLLGPAIALAAGAALALAPAATLKTHVLGPDVGLAFWIALAFAFAAKALVGGRAGWLVLGGVAAGLAFGTKYPGLAAGLPLAFVPLSWLRAPEALRPPSVWLATGLAALAGLAVFLATSPLCVLHPQACLEGVLAMRTVSVDLGASAPLPRSGWQSLPYVYQLGVALPFCLGLPLCLAAYLGTGSLARESRRAAWLLASFALPYAIVMSSSRAVYPRYYLPLLPPLSIAAGCLLVRALRGAAGTRRAVVALLALATAGYTFALSASLAGRFSLDDREAVVAFFEHCVDEVGPVTVSAPYWVGPYEAVRGRLEAIEGVQLVPFARDRDPSQWPDFAVYSRTHRLVRQRTAREPERSFWRRLERGDAGYERFVEIRAPYLTGDWYAALDPLLESLYSNGQVGFEIWRRVEAPRNCSRNSVQSIQ